MKSESMHPEVMNGANDGKEIVAIIGAGAFGCALSLAFARNGISTILWGRNEEHIDNMKKSGYFTDIFSNIPLHKKIVLTSSKERLSKATIAIFAVPTQNLGFVTQEIIPFLNKDAALFSAAKGIEQKTGRFVTDIMIDAYKQFSQNKKPPFGIISGPSFAKDIANGLPTAITIATADANIAKKYAFMLSSPHLRLYHSTDVRGVEIGGAAKNVLAIAAGITQGLGLGESAKAAIVTRGFTEISRFAVFYGARIETITGLSGLGDLILTTSSTQSRNFSLGVALGMGKTLEQASSKLTEGVFTAPILRKMAEGKNIEMPIVATIDDVLSSKISIKEAIDKLMARPIREE